MRRLALAQFIDWANSNGVCGIGLKIFDGAKRLAISYADVDPSFFVICVVFFIGKAADEIIKQSLIITWHKRQLVFTKGDLVKSIRKFPKSWNLQAILTGAMLKDWSMDRENNLQTKMDKSKTVTTASKNWKIGRSKTIAFTRTEKLSDLNYGATKQLRNYAAMTQHKR